MERPWGCSSGLRKRPKDAKMVKVTPQKKVPFSLFQNKVNFVNKVYFGNMVDFGKKVDFGYPKNKTKQKIVSPNILPRKR